MAKRKTAGAKSESGTAPVAEEVKAENVVTEEAPVKKEVKVKTPIRDEWKKLVLVDIKDSDSQRSMDVTIRRDQQKHGFGNRVYKKLRTQGEGTGYCVLIYSRAESK